MTRVKTRSSAVAGYISGSSRQSHTSIHRSKAILSPTLLLAGKSQIESGKNTLAHTMGAHNFVAKNFVRRV